MKIIFAIFLSFSCFIDIATANNNKNQRNKKNSKTGSLKSNNSWKTLIIIPAVTIMAR